MQVNQMSTPTILVAIAELQRVQQVNSPASVEWREASALLEPLFAEMAKREPKCICTPFAIDINPACKATTHLL